MIQNIKFIHCALPDIDFNEISIKQKIKIKANNKIKTISCMPFAVEIKSKNTKDINKQIAKINIQKNIALFFTKSKFFIFINKHIIEFNIKANKKNTDQFNPNNAIIINNGLDAAKCIRLKQFPILSDINKINLIEKQLKVVMFLTNSKNIAQLALAPIVYVV